MRLLFICAFVLHCSWASAQENELDTQYTPPSKYVFSQSKGLGSGINFFSRAGDAPFLWAVKYDLTKAFKSHHQMSFEMSVNDWFSIEPLLGVLTNTADMSPGSDGNLIFLQEINLGFNNQPATALDYQRLLSLATPRNNSILSTGFLLNLYSNGDRSFEDMAYMLQLGYQFQHMAYTLGETVEGLIFPVDSREGFARRQQLTIFLGGQMVLGDRLPFTLEYGLVGSFNFLTSPTFLAERVAPNQPLDYTFKKLEYATAMIPTIGFRVKVGMGFNP